MGHPCPREVLERAFSYLRAREAALGPGSFVLVHGDPHGGNALRTLAGDGYKLIDPDGLWYEKAYDLGVLLREWRETTPQTRSKRARNGAPISTS